MIEELPRSSGNTLAFRVSGDVTKADYDVLRPATEAALKAHDDVNLLLDLSDFKWEKIDAWKADLKFGQDFRKDIAKLAVVGDGLSARLIGEVAHPFYAKESRSFTDDAEAWTWLTT